MKTYNIKENMPSVELALNRVNVIIKYEKDKAIKLIHGYGSHGVGGKIKEALHQYLDQLVNQQKIKAYIPGEAFGYLLGYDQLIKTYQQILKTDSDYKKSNEGITYIML
jgi:hypothetical protein